MRPLTKFSTEPPPSRRRAGTVLLWTAQILLGVGFVSMGIIRLTGSSTAIETFEQIGLGQWLRFVTGAVELAGGVGLLIPRLAGPAATGLVGVMAGATAANVLVLSPVMAVLTVALGVVAAGIAWARRAEVKDLLGRVIRR
ncbi:DoxX family protein [Dactylosporangium sp. NPDC050688]|uniref:DoxX family protein n=1 Tax=Dactylosporangium sp. NPDC050688 TaxID=3157217 RepID=UPI0033DCBB74